MDQSQGTSLILSSKSCVSRSSNPKERRHLCFCEKAVIVRSSSAVSHHGRRYVACGRLPKCNFFEWIDSDDCSKNGCSKEKSRRVHCFCGDTLILRTSGTSKNSNRRFISCPNRRYKFFEWVDESGATEKDRVSAIVRVVGTQDYGKLEAEIKRLDAQERKTERLSVEIEKLIVESGQMNACVGRLCDEFNSL